MGGRVWTEAEDDAVREAARHAGAMFGHLKDCAADLGRSYAAVRQRAHRLGLSEPRTPAEPVEAAVRHCTRCGEPIRDRLRRDYCSTQCGALARGRCPGCGKKLYVSGGEAWCTDTFCRRSGKRWAA